LVRSHAIFCYAIRIAENLNEVWVCIDPALYVIPIDIEKTGVGAKLGNLNRITHSATLPKAFRNSFDKPW
jgi:hypothetical protein